MNGARAAAPSETIRIGQIEIRYLQAAGVAGDMSCFEMQVPPGAGVPPPHSHVEHEELVYVLDGTLRYTVGSVTRDLGPGDTMGTPRGVAHAFANPHPAPARVLVMNSPGIDPQYFRDVAAIASAGGPPDRARLASTMQRYGLTPVSGAPAAGGPG
jgi:quercetin dioxygenase-like cupin family protein